VGPTDASWVSQGGGTIGGMDVVHDTDVRVRATVASTAEFDRRLLEVAGRQHYVVSRSQLREFGTARQIEHRLDKGFLEREHEGVYRVAGSPRTWYQQLHAACLASSGANAVSFRAGAKVWGLPGGEEIVEITAPRQRRMQLDGVRIHESFYLTDRDVTYVDGLPVTRPSRVICDLVLLVWRGEIRPSTLELALLEVLRRGLVDL
jgi:predicted transcriptional regulator of viral defense system